VLLAVSCGLLWGQGKPKGGTLNIEVVDPTGTGVPHAEIRFSPPPENGLEKLETATNGKLTLNLKPGSYTLVVACPGFQISSTPITVRDAEEIQTVSIRMQIGYIGSVMVEPAHGVLASAGVQVSVDATKQKLARPPRGRGPFPGSDSAGHSAGLPVRLELVVPTGELSADGTIPVDFLITNVGSGPIRLPSSVREDSDRPFSLLTLWVTGDAIKKQYAVDQQTGRLFEVAIVVTSAELYDFGDDADGFALLPPNASMLVHASSHVELHPGNHSITAHAELARISSVTELVGTADSETFRKTFIKLEH
jgi:hypothetical protein